MKTFYTELLNTRFKKYNQARGSQFNSNGL